MLEIKIQKKKTRLPSVCKTKYRMQRETRDTVTSGTPQKTHFNRKANINLSVCRRDDGKYRQRPTIYSKRNFHTTATQRHTQIVNYAIEFCMFLRNLAFHFLFSKANSEKCNFPRLFSCTTKDGFAARVHILFLSHQIHCVNRDLFLQRTSGWCCAVRVRAQ